MLPFIAISIVDGIITYNLIPRITQHTCSYASYLANIVKIIRFMYTILFKKNICCNISPSEALQAHITSDKHFGEPSAGLLNTMTHLLPHNLNPQHKQLTGQRMNKHEHNNQKQFYVSW